MASSTLHSGVRVIPLAEPWARRELLVGVRDYGQASPSVKTLIGSLLPAEQAVQPEGEAERR
ncbi:hypothetical protein [Enterobacter hormaechei]|uniref:hypothetical protein n=1 Tax=Enterobacter hormaechei TaxID=158836 RepID=UPI0022356A4D|nr:hypothetical protein [Enterobacter hormaechei]MCW4691746.1 hypothetical protein [Enterobacter hormaechei subsp. hoffmannii]MCW4696208.1 hypothetical protein [Enterobacter hormaechei subsp. hoffmannii]MCW4700803.1 hypothetical protein [Enterobacter hormaechei subsp. hoffmannii]MCW4718532.1 hypothetical protein [Enterobacter hormaechei subsp. hoffmannii]MCW4732090.1 hypothetical protein [Enterobacter hormaechei subsp. hoffmannii]